MTLKEFKDQLQTELGKGKPVSIWVGKRPSGNTLAAATEALEVFMGESLACERRLAHSTVRLENKAVGGK